MQNRFKNDLNIFLNVHSFVAYHGIKSTFAASRKKVKKVQSIMAGLIYLKYF